MALNFRRQRSHDHLLANADEVADASTFTFQATEKKKTETKIYKVKRSTPDPWLKKPLWAVSDLTGDEEVISSIDSSTRALHRHLTLFDLISLGVSATIGSGVFVLCGLIAHDYAGPATFISWIIAGLSACFSGLCYAELSGKFAAAGSSYNYVFVTMGELPAVIAGACLSLEYVFASSAVARSWGDKVVAYVVRLYTDSDSNSVADLSPWMQVLLDPGYNVNPPAFFISTVCIILLLCGVKESQQVANFFTVFKVCLVLFMCFTALSFMQPENFRPLFPVQFGGIVGIMRGGTSSLFGMIGYDGVCCMGGEAVNPKRDLPRAVMGTIFLVTVLYVLAAIALVGMVPYNEISVTSGFPDGFEYRGIGWASQISAIGEIFALPIVVLVAFMSQPRVQFAMSIDGLLPPIFGEVDEAGNLWYGTLISGVFMVVVATLVPFTYLDDLISAGVLLAFSLTDASVVLLRCESPKRRPFLLQKLLCLFDFFSLTIGLLLKFGIDNFPGKVMTGLNILFLAVISFAIVRFCPEKQRNNNTEGYFETPLVPYVPLIGQFLNFYLIGQLEKEGLMMLLGYLVLAVIYYYIYGTKHSYGNNVGWHNLEEETIEKDLPSNKVNIEKDLPSNEVNVEKDLSSNQVNVEKDLSSNQVNVEKDLSSKIYVDATLSMPLVQNADNIEDSNDDINTDNDDDISFSEGSSDGDISLGEYDNFDLN